MSYSELDRELRAIEAEALIQIAWRGPVDFTVLITPQGARVAEQG